MGLDKWVLLFLDLGLMRKFLCNKLASCCQQNGPKNIFAKGASCVTILQRNFYEIFETRRQRIADAAKGTLQKFCLSLLSTDLWFEDNDEMQMLSFFIISKLSF